MIVSDRIRLRAVTEDDLPRFVAWLNDPEVTQGLSRVAPLSLEEEQRWFQEAQQKDAFERPMAIDGRLEDGWAHIGSCSFFNHDPISHNAELGIVIGDKRFWDQGFGTETLRLLLSHGFETLNFHRIYLQVMAFNHRAQSAYEKAGFVLEGRLRQDIYRRGRYWDTLVMSVLRSEWPGDPAKEA